LPAGVESLDQQNSFNCCVGSTDNAPHAIVVVVTDLRVDDAYQEALIEDAAAGASDRYLLDAWSFRPYAFATRCRSTHV
jgi:hypothetical protein